MHASHEALTLHSPWLTLLARCECLKRHGVGEREGDLGADLVLPRNPPIGCGELASFSVSMSHALGAPNHDDNSYWRTPKDLAGV